MSISYVTAVTLGARAANPPSFDLTLPTFASGDLAVDDIIVIHVMSKNLTLPANEINTPTDYTEKGSKATRSSGTAADMQHTAMFWKRAVAADDGATVTISRAGTSTLGIYGIAYIWRGAAKSGDPFDAADIVIDIGDDVADTDADFSAFDPAADRHVVYFSWHADDATTMPTDLVNGSFTFTIRDEQETNIGTDATAMLWSADHDGTALGAVTKSFTSTAGTDVGYVYALIAQPATTALAGTSRATPARLAPAAITVRPTAGAIRSSGRLQGQLGFVGTTAAVAGVARASPSRSVVESIVLAYRAAPSRGRITRALGVLGFAVNVVALQGRAQSAPRLRGAATVLRSQAAPIRVTVRARAELTTRETAALAGTVRVGAGRAQGTSILLIYRASPARSGARLVGSLHTHRPLGLGTARGAAPRLQAATLGFVSGATVSLAGQSRGTSRLRGAVVRLRIPAAPVRGVSGRVRAASIRVLVRASPVRGGAPRLTGAVTRMLVRAAPLRAGPPRLTGAVTRVLMRAAALRAGTVRAVAVLGEHATAPVFLSSCGRATALRVLGTQLTTTFPSAECVGPTARARGAILTLPTFTTGTLRATARAMGTLNVIAEGHLSLTAWLRVTARAAGANLGVRFPIQGISRTTGARHSGVLISGVTVRGRAVVLARVPGAPLQTELALTSCGVATGARAWATLRIGTRCDLGVSTIRVGSRTTGLAFQLYQRVYIPAASMRGVGLRVRGAALDVVQPGVSRLRGTIRTTARIWGTVVIPGLVIDQLYLVPTLLGEVSLNAGVP